MKDVMFGKNREYMPNLAFKVMSFVFSIRDIFISPSKKVDKLQIEEGFTVVDYGCGTGSYIKRASELVGEKGKVIGVDIHEIAVLKTRQMAEKYKLNNVEVF